MEERIETIFQLKSLAAIDYLDVGEEVVNKPKKNKKIHIHMVGGQGGQDFLFYGDSEDYIKLHIVLKGKPLFLKIVASLDVYRRRVIEEIH